MTLDQFKKSSGAKKRQQSRLFEFKSQILDLVDDGYTQQSILAFLRKNGLKTSQQNLSFFLKHHNHNKETHKPLKATSRLQPLHVESQTEPKVEETWPLPVENPKGVKDFLAICGVKK